MAMREWQQYVAAPKAGAMLHLVIRRKSWTHGLKLHLT